MVINIDSSRFLYDHPAISARSLGRSARLRRNTAAGQCVTIGLLNNMAGAAFKATERQFISLLDSASKGIPVHVSFYTLPGLSRAEAGGPHFASHYASVETLFDSHLDGLIVTGREPRMADLRDEPYWQSFTEVLEWARNNTCSTVWSCLAAHAAILHMDGIDRRKSDEKNFGVFNCEHVSKHALTEGLPIGIHVPHSRWNGVAQDDLVAGGYSVLSRIAGDGVDTFIKQDESLFVFFQGHLEYETDTLAREYRRDVGRFVKGEISNYPLLPTGYFDRITERALMELRDRAVACRSLELITAVGTVVDRAKIENTWQSSASRVYRNWLEWICARKGEGQLHSGGARSVSR
jgi:homoserine O-succinyltransferase/O-acetyltransferase